MPSLSEEECTRLQQEIKKLEQELASCEESEKQAKLFEQIGLDYADLDEIEQAISALENSLAHKESIGDGYKRLMSLYNRKRGEAAHKGDDQGIDYYMGKMDDMRQIAKKVTIKGNN
ncbi:tetratricopeptide repeat protein [Enterococcus durans]|uniref:tetratricopeptide repeat protein n=1 Tax=Enterococcus durans TaxID=53345 RepID=UPI0011BF291D|nr:tetratricopeptide repeat protein [Enterococcus durans]QED60373.1 tetratricopeptide repeat protein [Enterococcus durans]QED62936.1 tetratricopeptide repeat protein [Enterococcus durans]